MEIFGPTVQGEGRYQGHPAVFVRTAGCDNRCKWCDTSYAQDPLRPEQYEMTSQEIYDKIRTIAPTTELVVLTGGNPVLHDLKELVRLLRWLRDETGDVRTHRIVSVETQGTKWKPWLMHVDHITLSPKPPSSGNTTSIHVIDEFLYERSRDVDLKIVIFDHNDFQYARDMHRKFPRIPMYLQPGNPYPEMHDAGVESLSLLQQQSQLLFHTRRLVEAVIKEPNFSNVRVLPQLHVLLWGSRRGV